MKVYETLSLQQFIDKLDELGDAQVRGLDGEIHSYRGFYERNATTPCEAVRSARELAAAYRDEVGKEIYGWKGGEYTVRLDELIYYAQPGDTGPCLSALEPDEDGVYEPVAVQGDFW